MSAISPRQTPRPISCLYWQARRSIKPSVRNNNLLVKNWRDLWCSVSSEKGLFSCGLCGCVEWVICVVLWLWYCVIFSLCDFCVVVWLCDFFFLYYCVVLSLCCVTVWFCDCVIVVVLLCGVVWLCGVGVLLSGVVAFNSVILGYVILWLF